MTLNLRNISWAIMTGFAVILFAITAEYLSFKSDINFLLVKQDIVFDPIWRPTFYLHVISGMAVILIGPFQFLKKFRNKNLGLHKTIGKIYVYSVLGIAAPTGLIMAFYAEGGTSSTIAFIIMSFLWFITTLLAIIKVKQNDIIAHQKWMMRSFALSFAAVTLRLMVPVLSELINVNDEFIIVSTAWWSWLLNLIIVEGMILARFKSTPKPKKI